MAERILHLFPDNNLSYYFPSNSFIDNHGHINWWDDVPYHYDEVKIGDLTLIPEADKLVLFFDKVTKECIAYAWTDEDPVERELFPDLV